MKSEDYRDILNQYMIIDQDDKPYVTLKGVELVLKMHEIEVKKLHKPIVMPSLPDGLNPDSNCDHNYRLGWEACWQKLTEGNGA